LKSSVTTAPPPGNPRFLRPEPRGMYCGAPHEGPPALWVEIHTSEVTLDVAVDGRPAGRFHSCRVGNGQGGES
jgi:hypothetical protein